eukprot:gene29590-35719_t
MWSAIKSDLLDFVTTIQADTSKTLNKVLGEEDDEQEEESLQAKLIADLRRSYETYANPLRENRQKDFERFKKHFSLAGHAQEIGAVLDAESEVSRFYAELVPLQVSAEIFWARYFFRLKLLTRLGRVNFEEEDEEEEELVWDEEGEGQGEGDDASPVPLATASLELELKTELKVKDTRISQLEAENKNLKDTVSSLSARVSDLERELREMRASQASSSVAAAVASAASAAEGADGEGEGEGEGESSEGSGVIVDPPPPLPTPSPATPISRTAPPTTPLATANLTAAAAPTTPSPAKTSAPSTAAKFLAALDEDEEDGWN